MTHADRTETDNLRWPRWWRMFVIASGALILCSCRTPDPTGYDTSAPPMDPAGMSQGVPSAQAPTGPWAPPGISQPWPQDEYLRDGGDRGLPAEVGEAWEVLGLELEDTIAHYDTVDGQTMVEPSNRVHIYSPRFGAVRHVSTLVSNKQANKSVGMHLPTALARPTTLQIVTSSKQNVQAQGQIAAKPPVVFRSRQGDGVVSTTNKPQAFQDKLLPFENLQLIRMGTMDSAEMAQLAQGTNAAIAWSHNQAVQVILDLKGAMEEVSDQKLTSVFTVEQPPGKSRLRVVKVASTQFAEPGDEVAFTIRFDNVGTQPVGNVTLIDNLTTRLEYIADSAQCSVEAEVSTQPNEGDSLVIRCEIAAPLEAGQGGILRFRCRVR